MKSLILSPVIVLMFILVSFSSRCLGSPKDSVSYIEIKGKVFVPNKNFSDYNVQLFCNNILVDSVTLSEESFLLRVVKDSFFTLRIGKIGYLPMVISVNTYNPHRNKFNFDEGYFVTLHGFNLSIALENKLMSSESLADR